MSVPAAVLTIVRLWHFQCPECGMRHEEHGELAGPDLIYCDVCFEDGLRVRLRRWEPDHAHSTDHEQTTSVIGNSSQAARAA